MAKARLKIIPLGGLGEIGRNMMALEYGEDIVVIDAGLMFPEEEMLGVDLVIPDITYLKENHERVRAILITHGHEDHVGALPYILPQLDVPVYGSPLVHGLISVKLREHRLLKNVRLNMVRPGDVLQIGCFRAEFFRVCHSIPDSFGIALHTPIGTVVHTGDFKLDHTPVDGKTMDLHRLAELGDKGVLLLMSDSTYVERPGYTPSEQVVGQSLDRIMGDAKGRVVVASFASLISRIQQVVDAAEKHGRRMFIMGRSMLDNAQMAIEMGYLTVPSGLGTPDELKHLPPERIAVMTTGSQGEPTSALSRMANRDHRFLEVIAGDTVVISASPIPGNVGLINRTIDALFQQGANVLYQGIADVHVHGHGAQEELKLMLRLVRPRFFVPVHGEYRHLVLHARLAHSLGIPEENTFVLQNGDVLEVTTYRAKKAGQVSSDYIYVDGLGDIGQVVLRDRQHLAQDGILLVVVAVDKDTGKVIGEPDVISRGFVDVSVSEQLMTDIRTQVVNAIDHGKAHTTEWGYINPKIKETVAKYVYKETRRRPMILPVAVEV
ncbi:MAG: ribonuclease J [Chloroflexi bacterium]|nr:ribonuclease J [Chloroflexota bacterium]